MPIITTQKGPTKDGPEVQILLRRCDYSMRKAHRPKAYADKWQML